MIDDKYIIEHFLGKTDKINRFAIQRITDEELKYLQNRYNDSDSINETILRIKYNIDVHPHCKTCGKRLGFYYSRKLHKTNEYCSQKCKANNPEVIEKTKKTCLEKYGCENPGASKEAQEKIKKTMLEHYGVEHAFKSKEVKDKIIESHRKNLGVDWPMQSKKVQEKSKQTCLEKYGCEYTGQTEIKKQKSRETFLKHYGVDHNWKNKECWLKTLENRFKNKIEINNISSSKPEQICFELLKTKFNKVLRQRKDKKLYPYFCDFYIKDIDTWIEYNGFMTHCGHPFNPNNIEDQNKLNELKIKDSNHQHPGNNLFNSTIQTWTIYDPLKRQTAKDNNLNYLEFFSVDELKIWLDHYGEDEHVCGPSTTNDSRSC